MLRTVEEKAERAKLASCYQAAYEKFTIARQEVNKAQRAMRLAEQERLRYAQLMFEMDQLILWPLSKEAEQEANLDR